MVKNKKVEKKVTKLTKSQEKINLILETEKNYRKFRAYSGLETKRIKEIKSGKSKPTRSEIGYITNYQFSFKSGEIKAQQLSKISGFSTETIIKKMTPALQGAGETTWIDTLHAKNGKFVVADRRNGQGVYYYVIFKLDHRSGKTTVGHGFMVKQNVEGMLKMSGGKGIKTEYQSGEQTYITEYLIFNVLTFKDLAAQVQNGWLFDEENFYQLM